MEILNKNDFQEKVNNSSLAVIDFFATWCGPCKMLSPILEELDKERENINFFKVDVDEDRQLAMEFRIQAMPTVVIMRNGKEIQRFIGWKSKEEIKEILDNLDM